MEGSLPPECVAVVGSGHVRDLAVRDGVGVDAKREHQPVRGNTPGCKSIRSCMSSVQVSGIPPPR